MATTLNESAVEQEAIGAGVMRQRLLDAGRVPHTKVLLDRIVIEPGASFELHMRGSDIGWLQCSKALRF